MQLRLLCYNPHSDRDDDAVVVVVVVVVVDVDVDVDDHYVDGNADDATQISTFCSYSSPCFADSRELRARQGI